MSRLLDLQPKQIAYISAGIAFGAATCYFSYKLINRYLDERVPTKWRKVAEVSELFCFPIKSCGFIRLDEFECSQIGIENNLMRDRVFMITKNGEFITGRAYPNLVLIMPVIKDDIMTLSAPGMQNIDVDIKRLYSIPPITAFVWGQEVKVVDAGELVAQWLSRYVLKEDSGLRLVFYPHNFPTRDVREKNKIFDSAIEDDTGALHDATSFVLMNESSVTDLNSRLKKPVLPLQFRPNIVIKGASAFDEDAWKWIKINDTVFKNVKPCTRCIFTNIDPETAERNPDEDPLKTLKSYRKFKKCGESPVLGIHLGLRKNGSVKVGDAVFVEDY